MTVAGEIPTPLRATVGLLLALSLTVSVPDRVPNAAGVKKTEILQLAPAARVVVPMGQVVVVEKSERLVVIEFIVSAIVWLLVTVTVEAALFCPKASFPKDNEDGVAVTAAIPVPLKLTVCGLFFPVSEMVNVPVRDPRAAGVNVSEIVQLSPAASVDGLVGQVLVWL